MLDTNFVDRIMSERQPSVIIFGASWSGDSEIMQSMINRISTEHINSVHFCKVDIEESPDLAKFFNVYSVPTVIMIKEGEIVDLVRGFLPASKMRQLISENFVES